MQLLIFNEEFLVDVGARDDERVAVLERVRIEQRLALCVDGAGESRGRPRHPHCALHGQASDRRHSV